MNTDTINQTLVSLESNLRNLKSAREQVELVTDSSNSLIDSVNNLLEAIEGFSDNLKSNEVSNLKDAKKFKDLTKELNLSLKNVVIDIESTYKDCLKNVEIQLEAVVDKGEGYFNQATDSFKSSTYLIKDKLESSIFEFGDASKKQLEEAQSDLSKFKEFLMSSIQEIDTSVNKQLLNHEKQLNENIIIFKENSQAVSSSVKVEIEELRKGTVAKVNHLNVVITNRFSALEGLYKKQQKTFDEYQELVNQSLENQNKQQMSFSIAIIVLLVLGFTFLAI